MFFVFVQDEDGIEYLVRSRGVGEVEKGEGRRGVGHSLPAEC